MPNVLDDDDDPIQPEEEGWPELPPIDERGIAIPQDWAIPQVPAHLVGRVDIYYDFMAREWRQNNVPAAPPFVAAAQPQVGPQDIEPPAAPWRGWRNPLRKDAMPQPQPEGKPIDLDKYLDTVQNRIARVGLEVEGGWCNPLPDIQIIRDGSVKDLNNPVGGPPLSAIGEIVSQPLIPARVRPWLKRYYPQSINQTCGLHVHMSFRSALHYAWLIDPCYQETVLEYLRRFGEREGVKKGTSFWPRISGNHEHCFKYFWPERQIPVDKKVYDQEHAHGRPGNRYTAINYCWGQHRTIECRVLPMFKDVEMGIKAVLEVLRITNASLVALSKKHKPVKADYYVEQDGSVQEVRRVLV